MLMHLRMSGRLHLIAQESPRKKHEHVILNFKGGKQLRFHDTRKFGRIYLTSDADKISRPVRSGTAGSRVYLQNFGSSD